MSVTAIAPVSRAAALDVRLVRAAAFATTGVTLAAAAHSAAGGQLSFGLVAFGWFLVWTAAVAGAGRRRSLPAITAAVALGQLGLHQFFSAGHAAAPLPRMAGMPCWNGLPMGPAEHHAHLAGAAGTAAHGGLPGLSPGMLAGHAAAALATGWLLHRVESAMWRLLGLVRAMATAAQRWGARFADAVRLLTRDSAAPTVGLPRSGHVRRAAARPRESVLLRHSVIRRGPPRGVYA